MTDHAKRIYEEWDDALGRKDVDAAMRLYTEDATLESPLVRHILGTETGIIEGREQLRAFVEKVFERTPEARRRDRRGFFTAGTVLMWEYPRGTPDGEQMDFVETMELEDGRIRHHRVYWGWFGGKILEDDAYRR